MCMAETDSDPWHEPTQLEMPQGSHASHQGPFFCCIQLLCKKYITTCIMSKCRKRSNDTVFSLKATKARLLSQRQSNILGRHNSNQQF